MRAVREDRAGEREDVLVQGGVRRAAGKARVPGVPQVGLSREAERGSERVLPWVREDDAGDELLAENRRRERRDGGALVRRVLQEGPSATHERGSERDVRDVRGDDERWTGVAAQG